MKYIFLLIFLLIGCSDKYADCNYVQGTFIYKYIANTNEYRVVIQHDYAKPNDRNIYGGSISSQEDCKVADKETYDSIELDSYAWHNYKSVYTIKGTVIRRK